MLITLYIALLLSVYFSIANRSIYLLSSFFIIILIGQLKTAGPDHNDYAYILSSSSNLRNNIIGGGVEPIWITIVGLFDFFELPLQIRFGLIALASFLFHYYALSSIFARQKYLFIVGMTIYMANDFIIRDLGQIRNGLASGVLLLAILMLKDRKFLWSAISSVICVLCHTSFVYPLIGWLLYRKNHPGFSYLFMVSGLLGISYLLTVLVSYIPITIIQSRLTQYTTSEIYANPVEGVPIYIVIVVCVIFTGIFHYRKLDEFERQVIFLYVLALVTFLSFSDFEVLSSRLTTTVTSLNCMIIPLLMTKFKYLRHANSLFLVPSLGFFLIGVWYMQNFIQTYSL